MLLKCHPCYLTVLAPASIRSLKALILTSADHLEAGERAKVMFSHPMEVTVKDGRVALGITAEIRRGEGLRRPKIDHPIPQKWSKSASRDHATYREHNEFHSSWLIITNCSFQWSSSISDPPKHFPFLFIHSSDRSSGMHLHSTAAWQHPVSLH